MPTRPFETLMLVEGRWTGDERLIMVDGLSWDGLLPMCLTVDHGEGVTSIVGRVDEIERRPGATLSERHIIGRGVLDLSAEDGPEITRQIEEGFLRGVSVDIDAVELGGVDPATADDGDMWALVVETARIRGLALCPIPAFAEAYITLGALDASTEIPRVDGPTPIPAEEVVTDNGGEEVIIIAAGHTITLPESPPAEWFAEPTDVEIAGALTVTDEGRVYGLLAPANVAHIGRADGVTVPLGNVNYSRFMRGETVTADGRVTTGNVTMNCGHGDPTASAASAVEHYDNTCALVATIAVGERSADPRGVWVAGALLPGVTADQVQRMMACQLSGHWCPRPDGGYDLVGALLVPVPGFPFARSRPSVTSSAGRLVASAIPVSFATEPAAEVSACSCQEPPRDDTAARLERIERMLAPAYLASLNERFASLTAGE